MTRALIIGAGSIGGRHAEVLGDLGAEVAFVSARSDLELRAYPSVGAGVDGFEPDYVVIATETAGHAASAAQLRDAGYRGVLLVEKPLAIARDVLDGFERVGVGFNLRFHPVLLALAALLDGVSIHTVEAYAGQHLSTWRPARSSSEQYSASRSRGGGVLRDLSHELDYLGMLLGGCNGVFARGGRIAHVTVDSDDAWGIVAEYERTPVLTLQLNYLDTQTRRRLVINSSAGTTEADLVTGVLHHDGSTQIFESERNDTYRLMHLATLEGIDGVVATVEDALATDAVIGMIEQSAASGKWVAR